MDIDRFRKVSAFQVGIAAWHADLDIADNPYPVGTPEFCEWHDGWISAERQAIDVEAAQ